MTGDRDMFQCAGDGVTILYVSTGGKRGGELVDAAARGGEEAGGVAGADGA